MEFKSVIEIETFFNQLTTKKQDYPPFFMLKQALKAIGNPEKKLQYIHVTGTNGKGSTANFIASILHSNKLNVGLFTSPHLMHITERFCVNGVKISESKFIAHFNRIYTLIGEQISLIQFEWLTLIAYDYFFAINVDIVVLEVGIGGTYDSTNIIPHKLAAVITNIGLDHTLLLGPSLAEIRAQKCGIITAQTRYAFFGKDVLVAGDHPPNSYKYGINFVYEDMGSLFTINNKTYITGIKHFPQYQYENLALAICVCQVILESYFNIEIDWDLISHDNQQFNLPIRFEKINYQERTIMLDGAHNISGIITLTKALKQHYSDKKLIFVFAAMQDKDVLDMLLQLESAGTVYLFDYQQFYARAIDINNYGMYAKIKTIERLEKLVVDSADNEQVVIVGSIYFVSYVRNKIFTPQRVT
ncbi:MAG: bifunctional folylpolyglutamate synthase/dihydrofolate synthase [Culicoidibacterales bacterium]